MSNVSTRSRNASPPDSALPSCCLPIGTQLIEVLKLHYRANRPFLLEGHTGLGKSELVEQVARELGIACVVLNLSLLEPPDLLGVPFQHDGRTIYASPVSCRPPARDCSSWKNSTAPNAIPRTPPCCC